jgi:hypothetical protein
MPFKRTLLPPGSDDFHLLGHMPGFTSSIENKVDDGEYTFPTKDGKATLRGVLTVIRMTEPPKQDLEITPLEVIENYREALLDLHAEILRDTRDNITARVNDDEKTVWIFVDRSTVVSLEEHRP